MPHAHVVGLGWRDRQGPNYVNPCWPPRGIWQKQQGSDVTLEWKETLKNALSDFATMIGAALRSRELPARAGVGNLSVQRALERD